MTKAAAPSVRHHQSPTYSYILGNGDKGLKSNDSQENAPQSQNRLQTTTQKQQPYQTLPTTSQGVRNFYEISGQQSFHKPIKGEGGTLIIFVTSFRNSKSHELKLKSRQAIFRVVPQLPRTVTPQVSRGRGGRRRGRIGAWRGVISSTCGLGCLKPRVKKRNAVIIMRTGEHWPILMLEWGIY